MGDTSIPLRRIPEAKYKFLNEFINLLVYGLLREEKFLSKHVNSYGSFNIRVTRFKRDEKFLDKFVISHGSLNTSLWV